MSEIFQQWQLWQRELNELGGRNPLVNFELSNFSHVDLTRSHPSGLAQLVAARNTRISNLIRDGIAQGRANSAIRRIKDKTDQLYRDFGLQSCFLSGGMVRFSDEDKSFPIILWPVGIGEKSDDHQVTVGQDPELNPELLSYLESKGIFPSKLELLRLARKQGELLPLRLLERFSEILSDTGAEIDRMLVIGNFTPQLSELRLASSFIETEIVQRLVNSAATSETPRMPLLVLPADQQQSSILGKIAAGNDAVIETLPGCGYTQLAVNSIATLLDHGKRVLVVSNRRQTLDELSERLAEVNATGLMIRGHNSWLDMISSISRFEKAEQVDFQALEEKVAEAEDNLQEYFHLLNQPQIELGVSLIDCIERLSELSAKDEQPTNSARFPEKMLVQLRDSESAMELLQKASDSGVFSFGAADTDWFKAEFDNQQQIDNALQSVADLVEGDLEMAREQLAEYFANLNLKPAQTVEHWSVQVKLLVGIRETLDKFTPEIYDRPLRDLITATSARQLRKEMSGAQRRRFKKLAKSYLRPSAQVGNLHNSLVEAQKQRELWYELADTKSPPSVPTGLANVSNVFERVADRITGIQKHLNNDPDIELLSRLRFADLMVKLHGLNENTEILDGYLDRKEIVSKLESAGLSDLGQQLTNIKPNKQRLSNEFQLSWWQSAFESVVAQNQKILDYDAHRLAELEKKYEQSNQDLIDAGASKLSYRQSKQWKSSLENTEQANKLKQLLKLKESSMKTIAAKAESIWPSLSNVVGLSPMELQSKLLEGEQFDVCIVMDAASVGVAEIIPSLNRCKQLVAFGDPQIATAMNFSTIALSASAEQVDRQSFFQLAQQSLGSSSISKSYRPHGQVMGEFLNSEFYQQRLTLPLTADQILRGSNYEFVHVTENNKATSTIEGATESADGELRSVVQLVLAHARNHPEQSLTVCSASATHAERIQKALRAERLKIAELETFWQSHGREGLVISSLSNLGHRVSDRVIFSLGFALTPEGRVKLSFGDLSGDQAAINLANLIATARKNLTVVSCIGEEDLPKNSKSAEIMQLRKLVGHSQPELEYQKSDDPLLFDLATRLRKRGVRVIENPSAEISMLAVYRNKVSLIDADWEIMNQDWRLYLRGARKVWSQHGFLYQRVHVFELFSEPDRVAKRLADALGVVTFVEKPGETHFESNDQQLLDNKPPHWS